MSGGIHFNPGGVSLADNSITAAVIAADAIGASEIAANAIGASEIADGAIDAATFAAGAITAAVIATDAIDADALAADAIAEIGVEVRAELNAAVPASPTADSLFDILSKTDNNTYNRSTDSLEAIADALASLTTGSYMQRSADSASTLADGTEQTLYENAPGTVFEFGGGSVYLPASAGATGFFALYIKNKSGGAYINILQANVGTYTGTATTYMISPSHSGTTNTHNIFAPRFNIYGLKITFTQDGVGAGYITLDSEFFDTTG